MVPVSGKLTTLQNKMVRIGGGWVNTDEEENNSIQENLMIPRLTIEVHNIMIIVNYAWSVSFANISYNKKDIAKRGWRPLNCNIVLDTAVRVNMTKTDIETEKKSGIVIPYNLTDNYVELDELLPTLDIQYLSRNTTLSKLNLKGGMAAWYLDAIVWNDDLMTSHERIRRDDTKG